ncbi:hypothetical protein D555_3618 [Bordetella holmesii 35009]|nr:hypothetical protein D555_3618 [Bordetella holmesii 35009]
MFERLAAFLGLENTGISQHLQGSDNDQPLHGVVFDHEDGRLFHTEF